MDQGKPVADLWYGIEPCSNRVIHIRETHIDQWAAGDIWLILGAERNLVFDTGTGIVPLRPIIEMLSDLPVLAVASCHYYDHAGGLHDFEYRACHQSEVDALSNPSGYTEALLSRELYALPYAGFDVATFGQRSTIPTAVYRDGDVIDLGDRKLEVLHIPGRTPGSIALWEAETKSLFGGETVFFDPPGYDFPPQQSAASYEQSLTRINQLPVSTLFGGHYGVSGPEAISRLMKREIGRYT